MPPRRKELYYEHNFNKTFAFCQIALVMINNPKGAGKNSTSNEQKNRKVL
jgi:hypothetical protein